MRHLFLLLAGACAACSRPALPERDVVVVVRGAEPARRLAAAPVVAPALSLAAAEPDTPTPEAEAVLDAERERDPYRLAGVDFTGSDFAEAGG